LKLGREAKTVEQTKNQNGQPGVGLKVKKPLESVHVVKSLVNDREPDNRIDHIGIRMDPAQHAAEQSQAVSNGKQADVLHDISEAWSRGQNRGTNQKSKRPAGCWAESEETA